MKGLAMAMSSKLALDELAHLLNTIECLLWVIVYILILGFNALIVVLGEDVPLFRQVAAMVVFMQLVAPVMWIAVTAVEEAGSRLCKLFVKIRSRAKQRRARS